MKISWCWKYLLTYVTDTSPLQFKTLQLNISRSWIWLQDKIHTGMSLYLSLYLYDINSSAPGRCGNHSKSLPFKLNFRVDILRNSYGIALWRMTKNPFWRQHWSRRCLATHDDVIKWQHFPRYWPFVRRIHRSSANSTHKNQWRGALMFSMICA